MKTGMISKNIIRRKQWEPEGSHVNFFLKMLIFYQQIFFRSALREVDISFAQKNKLFNVLTILAWL